MNIKLSEKILFLSLISFTSNYCSQSPQPEAEGSPGAPQKSSPSGDPALATPAAAPSHVAQPPQASAQVQESAKSEPSPAVVTLQQAQQSNTQEQTIPSMVYTIVTEVVTNMCDGIKDQTRSDGRRLLRRLEEVAKANKEFASGDDGFDIALIGKGVNDSIKKGKFQNVKAMIQGLKQSNAIVDQISRRKLRKSVTDTRNKKLEDLDKELKERIEDIVSWYTTETEPIIEDEKLRKTTFAFRGSESEDEEEAFSLEEPAKLKLRLNEALTAPIYSITKKAAVKK